MRALRGDGGVLISAGVGDGGGLLIGGGVDRFADALDRSIGL